MITFAPVPVQSDAEETVTVLSVGFGLVSISTALLDGEEHPVETFVLST